MRTVVDQQVLDVSEHLVHYLHSNISDDAWVLNDVSQAVLHQLRVSHLTYTFTKKQKLQQLEKESHGCLYDNIIIY